MKSNKTDRRADKTECKQGMIIMFTERYMMFSGTLGMGRMNQTPASSNTGRVLGLVMTSTVHMQFPDVYIA